jgi:acyl-coenzyme A thioesterase PaaI-like protein
MSTVTNTDVAGARPEFGIEPDETKREELRRSEHPACFACGKPAGTPGLGFAPRLAADGASVEAEWRAPAWATSYDGLVHGGLIATVLDAAMVHALFARGITARTARLEIRYRRPVQTATPCRVRAELAEARGPLRRLSATLHQAGALCTRATADFLPPASS